MPLTKEEPCGWCGENVFPGTPHVVMGDMDEPYFHKDCYDYMEEEGLVSH